MSLSEALAAQLSDPGALQEQVEFLERLTKRTIRILDASGQLVAGSTPSGFDLKDYFAAYVNLEDGSVLQVFMAKGEISNMSRRIARGSILIAIVVAASAVAVAYLVNRSITNPIQDLLAMVRSLQERQFGRMVLVRSTDEIGQLGRAC